MLRRRRRRREAAWQHVSVAPGSTAAHAAPLNAQAALAGGDLVAARRWADEAVATTTGLVPDRWR